MKKYLSTNKIYPVITVVLIIVVWQIASDIELVPSYMLPSPIKVFQAMITDAPLLLKHAKITLIEAFLGLAIGVIFGFILAVLMDHFGKLYNSLYPIIIVSQTIPSVALAPLLVLWFGYEMAPKIILIVIVSFFPITMGLIEGFKSVDEDAVMLLKSMGANRRQIFFNIKLPESLSYFFSGLKISSAYSIVGAVISEWLGGFLGLGVYMTRVKKSFAFDKMFAVIILVSAISLVLMCLVNLLQKKLMPWENIE